MATVAIVLRPRLPRIETVSPSNRPRRSMAPSVMPTTVCPSFASCRKTEREFLVGGPLDNIARELSLC